MVLRILMLLYNPIGKGTYWRALQLARRLAAGGHQITVVSTSIKNKFRIYEYDDVQERVSIVETPDLLIGSLRSGWDIWNVVRRILWSLNHSFDIVHGFESRPVVIFPALYWRWVRKVPLVLDWCDWFGSGGSVEERVNPLIRFFLRPVETFFEERFRTVANGTTVINQLLGVKAQQLGVNPESIIKIPNGSDIERLFPIPKEIVRRELGLDNESIYIGYIGAIFFQDAVLMAESFNRIVKVEPKVRLLLLGYFNFDIEDMLDYPEYSIRVGNLSVEQVNRYLAACDLCWLPLRNSGANKGRFPLKLNDYMAAGKALVATEVGEIADLILEKNIGIVSADNPRDLSEKVLGILRTPSILDDMGSRARLVAETELNWDLITLKLEDFYYQVINRRQ